MSILKNTLAEANRLELLISFLKKETRGYTKSELEDLFSPKSGRKESSVFKEVYNLANGIDIFDFKEQENGQLLIYLNKEVKTKNLIEYIESKIFTKEYSQKDKFALALGWLLIQDPRYPIKWSDNVTTKVSQDLNNEYELGLNSSNNQHFSYWTQYLGYSNKVSIKGKTHLIPDPTKAISRHIKDIFTNEKEMKFSSFLNRLSNKIPVLEYGWIRNSIEDKARDGLERNTEEVSISTSLALLRLEEKGIIKLLSTSDADVISLSGIKNKRITHIQYTGVKK